jgi:16S rRNA (uracil1498-N3)-methyltransferase
VPQFFVPRKNIRGLRFFFDPTESHHLIRVLRKGPGDTVRIFDGEGEVQTARIVDCSDPDQVHGELLPGKASGLEDHSRPDAPSSWCRLRLYPALLKGPKFEWLIEKITELGVESLQPIYCERTLIRLKPDQVDSKVERWRKIVMASAKQCGRKSLTTVESPLSFEQALRKMPAGEHRFLLWEREQQGELSQTLQELKDLPQGVPAPTIHLIVGPEGGFSLNEVKLARDAGVVPVGLGKNILRAETASIAAASVVLL